MAAVVAQADESPFCVAAHSATSGLWFGDPAKVTAALTDLDAAPIGEPLRATLRMLGTLAREHTVDADDIREVLAAGVSAAQIEDALAVCLAFDITARLANAFDFAIAPPGAMAAGARHLLRRGYR
jgi:alkylhydroperoxidase family enzyme